MSYKVDIGKWITAIYHGFNVFVDHHKKTDPNYSNAVIDLTATKDAVERWDIDLSRYEDYYYPGLCPYKQSSFLMYWIIRTKPIFLIGDRTQISTNNTIFYDEKYIKINENFAFDFALSLLTIDELRITKEIRDHFVDTLYCRDADPKHMLLTLRLLFEYVNADVRSGKAITQLLKEKAKTT